MRELEPNKFEDCLEEDPQLAIWAEVFKLHCVLQRYAVTYDGFLCIFISISSFLWGAAGWGGR